MIHVLIPTTKERRERLELCIKAIKESKCDEPITICSYENNDGGFVKAIHNMLSGLKDKEVVFCIGDDVIVAPDCIQKLYNELTVRRVDTDLPIVIQPYDEFHGGAISVNPFCEVWVMRKYTYKGYVHNYADVEFTTLIKHFGMYIYRSDAKVEHVHCLNKKAPIDETYKKCAKYYEQDQELFEKRKIDNFQSLNE